MNEVPKLIYHIFIDRFSTGDRTRDKELANCFTSIQKTRGYNQAFMGGNLRGIIRNINYIVELGADCIWLSPIFATSAYHGYHITNYYKIDERFGSSEDLKELIEIYHKNGIKVILDFVPNHCSKFHPFFIDAQKNRQSKYKDWFIFTKWPKRYLCFLDVPDIPKLNLGNKECRRHILRAARYWIKEFDIDGYRIDHAVGPPFDFWDDFVKTVKKVKEEVILLPEIWFSAPVWRHLKTLWFLKEDGAWKFQRTLGALLKTQNGRQDYCYDIFSRLFDTFPDFTFYELIRKHHPRSEKLRRLALDHFSRLEHVGFYLFGDNHDGKRLMYLCDNDLKKFASVLKLMFSFEKPVLLYYGTEIGMSHKDPDFHKTHKDREFRRFMNWNFRSREVELLDFTKNLISDLHRS